MWRAAKIGCGFHHLQSAALGREVSGLFAAIRRPALRCTGARSPALTSGCVEVEKRRHRFAVEHLTLTLGVSAPDTGARRALHKNKARQHERSRSGPRTKIVRSRCARLLSFSIRASVILLHQGDRCFHCELDTSSSCCPCQYSAARVTAAELERLQAVLYVRGLGHSVHRPPAASSGWPCRARPDFVRQQSDDEIRKSQPVLAHLRRRWIVVDDGDCHELWFGPDSRARFTRKPASGWLAQSTSTHRQTAAWCLSRWP